MTIAVWLLAALVTGSGVYCLLVVYAAWRFRRALPGEGEWPPISVLKPLAGADLGLEENLRTFFTQDYPRFEILFAVRQAEDPAAAVVERLAVEYPQVRCRLMVTGEPPYPNAKVWALARMIEAAEHEIVAMCDSDIRVSQDFLRSIAREFHDRKLDVTTCPYRAVPGPSFWSTLEAIGMNTEFLGGVLVARLVEGMRFAVGPTIVARRGAIEAIGGWDRLGEYLAEDFVLGQRAAEKGLGVGLSQTVVEHHIGAQPRGENFRHRLRWYRSTRRSRPAGYAGQVFTNPLPLVLLLWAAAPWLWPLCVAVVGTRAAAAWATAGLILRDGLCARRFYLIPLQDLVSFGFWLAGFFGNTIHWRGRSYRLHRDGRFTRADG